jgi:hypothetical protein
MPCSNCDKDGHTKQKCQYCPVCEKDDAGHKPKDCPTTSTCKICKIVGHRTTACPNALCTYCKQTGHLEVTCPERYIEGETDLTPAPDIFLPSSRQDQAGFWLLHISRCS